MARIRFRSAGKEISVESSAVLSLLNALVRGGARIRHDCGGKALCGTCRVRVIEARRGALSPIGERERARLDAVGAAADERLACQAYAVRDVTVAVE